MDPQQLSDTMTVIYKVMVSDEFTDSVADMMWKIYQKLKAKGFSEQQAMDITLHFAKSQSTK